MPIGSVIIGTARYRFGFPHIQLEPLGIAFHVELETVKVAVEVPNINVIHVTILLDVSHSIQNVQNQGVRHGVRDITARPFGCPVLNHLGPEVLKNILPRFDIHRKEVGFQYGLFLCSVQCSTCQVR